VGDSSRSSWKLVVEPLVNCRAIPGNLNPSLKGQLCSCGHPYEKHDARGRCLVPKGADAFGYVPPLNARALRSGISQQNLHCGSVL
jgi:hypothetical protein